jgi:hypothetical protein
MSIVQIEFDNKLKKSEIITPLLSSSKSELGESYNSSHTDKAQTSVIGIKMPLIKINSTVIDIDSINYFSLKSEGRLPELMMVVEDRYELINNIDKPSHDNEVRVQIIPFFENTYKKIDLTFYISSINVNGKILKLNCMYKLPELVSTRFKTFGEIDTYTLFKNNANDTKLGFATNISELTDKRYVYCDNKSILDMLNDEIQFSNASDHILDWWVDLWDNINLVDMKERYNAIDSNEDLKVWVSGQVNDITTDTNYKPIQVEAVINDHPGINSTELYVKAYSINNSHGSNASHGSDRVYSIYEDSNEEYLDYFIQDGDVKQDIFTKYEYLGESYGDYNYLLSKCMRNAYLQKINSETVQVTMNHPLLGLMRGHKVNYVRYVNDDMLENKMKTLEENDVINRNQESNVPLKDYEIESDSKSGKYRIDKTASGQYLIIGVNILYSNNEWDYVLKLTRPSDTKVNIINEDNK